MKQNIKKQKLEEIKNQLKPKSSILALVGILIFFFLPEVLAFFWPNEIKSYFLNLANEYKDDFLLNKLFIESADTFSQNSILNITIGILFVIWWIKERQKGSKNSL